MSLKYSLCAALIGVGILVSPIVGDALDKQATSLLPCSIVNLISTPKKYKNRRVQIKGFAVIEFENTAIYLSERDAEYLIDTNALWLTLPPEVYRSNEARQLDRHYVLVEGIFDPANTGHMGSFVNGGIRDISRMDILERSKPELQR